MAGLTAGVIFLRAATKAAATWRVAAVFTGPVFTGPAFTAPVLEACVAPACVVLVCATSAAVFFLVGISAFRSLGAAALATAAGLGFETGFVGATGCAVEFARGRRAVFDTGVPGLTTLSAPAFALATLVLALAAAGCTALVDVALAVADLTDVALAVAGLAFADLAFADWAVADLPASAPAALPVACFGLARPARAPIAERELVFADRAFADPVEDFATFAAGLLFTMAGFGETALLKTVLAKTALVDDVAFTAVRERVRVVCAASLVDRPRGVAAALAFGGMVKPLLSGAEPLTRHEAPTEIPGRHRPNAAQLRLDGKTRFEKFATPVDVHPHDALQALREETRQGVGH